MEKRNVFEYQPDEPELRVEEIEGQPPKIRGLAAPFNSISRPIGTFREIIAPGAFKKTLRENRAEIKALWNHNTGQVLASARNGSLKLRETELGLEVEIDPPLDASFGRDAVVSIKRGDVDSMSFGFDAIKDRWSRDADGGDLRTLVEVRLFEVSPVAFPAYPTTEVGLRSLFEAVRESDLLNALKRRDAGDLTDADRAALSRAAEFFSNARNEERGPDLGIHPQVDDLDFLLSTLRLREIEAAIN